MSSQQKYHRDFPSVYLETTILNHSTVHIRSRAMCFQYEPMKRLFLASVLPMNVKGAVKILLYLLCDLRIGMNALMSMNGVKDTKIGET